MEGKEAQSSQLYDAIHYTPIAPVGIRLEGDFLTALDWLPLDTLDRMPISTPARSVCRALDNYFKSPGRVPECRVKLYGTPFQRRVWRALQKIPAGRVLTYGELARRLKTGARAVGQACRTNPIAIFIPCHRIIAAGGIGGYSGKKKRLHIKHWLLMHEGVEWLTGNSK